MSKSIQLSTGSMEPDHVITQPMLGSCSTDALTKELQCGLKDLNIVHWRREGPTIFRGEENLSSLTEMEADYYFRPKLISIGPYHHGEKNIEAMERIKMYFLSRFLTRSLAVSNNISVISNEAQLPNLDRNISVISNEAQFQILNLYINEIKQVELQLRSTYSQVICIESEKFVKMMLLDGCFVVEFLICLFKDPDKLIDPYKETPLNVQVIMEDLMLLENQLPFFLLQKMFNFIHSGGNLCPIAIYDICLCYDVLTQTPNSRSVKKEYIAEVFESGFSTEPKHLLHLMQILLTDQWGNNEKQHTIDTSGASVDNIDDFILRLCGNTRDAVPDRGFVEGFKKLTEALMKKRNTDSLRHKTIPSASQLKEAGVKLKLKNDSKCLVDVTFHKGKLEIPKLYIFRNTMPLLWNMVAFEMCCFRSVGTKLSTHVMLIDNLIDTAEDATILVDAKVIRHSLGTTIEVANVFNRIGTQVATNRFDPYLKGVFDDVNEYYYDSCVRWRATLKRDYFSNPWSYISFGAALALLATAIVQMIFAILAYEKPKKP